MLRPALRSASSWSAVSLKAEARVKTNVAAKARSAVHLQLKRESNGALVSRGRFHYPGRGAGMMEHESMKGVRWANQATRDALEALISQPETIHAPCVPQANEPEQEFADRLRTVV